MTELNDFCKFRFGVHIEGATLRDGSSTSARASNSYRRQDQDNSPSTGRQLRLFIYGGVWGSYGGRHRKITHRRSSVQPCQNWLHSASDLIEEKNI